MSLATLHQQPEEFHGHDGGRYYTVAQAARTLQVHRTTILRWIEAGKLRAYRVGPKAVRIMERDLEAVITSANEKREGGAANQERADNEGGADNEAGRDKNAQAPEVVLARLPARRLTGDEIERGLAALKRLRATREMISARQGGKILPTSEALIREEREARSKRL